MPNTFKRFPSAPRPPKGLSKEQLFFWRWRNHPHWAIESFFKIRDKTANIVPFKLNKAQEIVLNMIYDNKQNGIPQRFIVLKARQMGLSTLFEALMLHDTITNENKNSLIIAQEEAASSNLYNMTKLYYENIPEILRPMKKYANGKVLSFMNPTSDESEFARNPGLRSKVNVSTAGTGEVGRSATYHNIHASEVAFFPTPKETMLGLMQTVPDQPNTLVVWETTANGIGNFFYDQWKLAERGDNDFTTVFLPWFIQPEYSREFVTSNERDNFIAEIESLRYDDRGKPIHTYEYELMKSNNLTYEQLNWRKHTIKNKCQGDEVLFFQEYPSTAEEAFISSGRPKFSIRSLRKYMTGVQEPIWKGYLMGDVDDAKLMEDEKGYLSIWKKPEPNQNYVIGADTAEGLATGDFSTGVVLDYDANVVAKWHGHIDADLFGKELIKLAKYYNGAYLGVENNNHGLTTLHSIRKEEYWNIFFTKTYDKISDTYSHKMGWSTSAKTKPLMIDKLAEFIREELIGIKDKAIIDEMMSYIIEDNGSTNAQEGAHDDLVMATGIALQLLLEHHGEDYKPEYESEKKDLDVIDPLFEGGKDKVEREVVI